MLDRLVPLADRFVPPWMQAAGPEMVRRGRTAVLIAWLMGVMFGGVLVMRLLAAEWFSALVDVGLVTACFAGPFLLRWTGAYMLIANSVLGAVFLLLVGLGATNPNPGLNAATVALAEIPLFAILLFGPRLGYLWSGACAMAVLGIGLSRFTDLAQPTAAEQAAFNEYWAAVIMSLTLVSAGLFYEQARNESLRRIQQLETQRRESELAEIRAKSDAKLQQAERFASLGRLAAAVAHEINNPLSYVQGNLSYTARELRDPNLQEALEDALEGVDRIRHIVKDLQGLSRPPEDRNPEADIHRTIRSAVAIASAHLRAKARLTVSTAPRLYAACDEPRLSQAILNLLINSAQALPDGQRDHHLIEVRAQRVEETIEIEVQDDGPGIPSSILHRVREPFFTTKQVGEGTGLGLALADGIVRSHGGALDIESQPGHTVVRITLPALDVLHDQRVAPRSDPFPLRRLRILVCDDEPLVARALSRHLAPHEVHAVSGGQEALLQLEHDDAFDLVLCDLMMPVISGMDVHDHLAQTQPELLSRFVFMSGGTFTERAQSLRETQGIRFLDKPVQPQVLRRLLQDVMRRNGLAG
ncbi:MAG: ATP-binding protein [Myxococcota bacterium]